MEEKLLVPNKRGRSKARKEPDLRTTMRNVLIEGKKQAHVLL